MYTYINNIQENDMHFDNAFVLTNAVKSIAFLFVVSFEVLLVYNSMPGVDCGKTMDCWSIYSETMLFAACGC